MLFCEEFLAAHPMKCIRGRLFTVDGAVEDEAVVQPLRPLVRLATEKDLDTVAKNREKEARAFFHLPGEDRRPWPGYEAGGGGVQL